MSAPSSGGASRDGYGKGLLRIAEDPRVVSVFDVTGDYDSMVVALARDRMDLNDFTKTVLSLDGIERSHTHMVLNSVKNTWIGLPEENSSD